MNQVFLHITSIFIKNYYYYENKLQIIELKRLQEIVYQNVFIHYITCSRTSLLFLHLNVIIKASCSCR